MKAMCSNLGLQYNNAEVVGHLREVMLSCKLSGINIVLWKHKMTNTKRGKHLTHTISHTFQALSWIWCNVESP